MFFDEPSRDEFYINKLKTLAIKQREILEMSFRWRDKTLISTENCGFFEKRKREQIYRTKLNEITFLKEEIRAYQRKKGLECGIYWWSLPWEDVEEAIINNLLLEHQNVNDNWRFERSLFSEEHEGCRILLLKEEGHLTILSKDLDHVNYQEESVYSPAERSEMVSEYNRRRNKQAMWNALTIDARVYSCLSRKTYDSVSDYYLSSEYYMRRMSDSDRYARSLYTEHITHEMQISSHSKHYECIYGLGLINVDTTGTAQQLTVYDYKMLDAFGDVPSRMGENYINKDAAVMCAAYLADAEDIYNIPMTLFGKDINSGAATYEEALMQAQIYTCIAYKIS